MNLYRVAWGDYPDPKKGTRYLVLAQSKGQCKRWAVQTFDTMPDLITKYDEDSLRLPRRISFIT